MDKAAPEIRLLRNRTRRPPVIVSPFALAPALNDFAKQYPQIELDVGFSDRLVSLVDEGFDLQIDPSNCGSCGKACSFSHAGPRNRGRFRSRQ